MARKPTSNTKRNRKRREEYAKERTLDKLAAFEEFQKSFSSDLQKVLLEGLSVPEMREHYATLLEARKLEIALRSKDEGRALAAIQDIQNRAEGKPTERVEQTHKFEKMDDQAFDALLKSKLAASVEDEDPETLQ